MPKQIGVAYIPVLHKGYLDFLQQLESRGITELYLIGDHILETHEELDYINRKDRLRALPLTAVQSALLSLTSIDIQELTSDSIAKIKEDQSLLVTPKEDIGKLVVGKYFSEHEVEYYAVFLRRNKLNVGEEKIPIAAKVSMNDFQTSIWDAVFSESHKSADWWRQVGAAIVKNSEVIYVTHNEHMPEEQTPNIEGDARSLFKKGIHINYVTSAHAEVAAIGAAAKEGFITDGAELFTTDFPCPYCARLIAKAGIKKLYYVRGYAVLDGDDFLKDAGVEVIHVQAEG